jgi:hypothetical protein
VFDAKRGSGGRDGRFTYPDEANGAPRPSWTAPEDGALVGTFGHLRPGGLWTDLKLRRDGRTAAATPSARSPTLGFTAAATATRGRRRRTRRPGKYTYLCRVHPFMRGAFEVKRKR